MRFPNELNDIMIQKNTNVYFDNNNNLRNFKQTLVMNTKDHNFSDKNGIEKDLIEEKKYFEHSDNCYETEKNCSMKSSTKYLNKGHDDSSHIGTLGFSIEEKEEEDQTKYKNIYFLNNEVKKSQNEQILKTPMKNTKVSVKLSEREYKNDKKTRLFKTEMCRSFSELGNCRYGDNCQFSHSPEELRKANRHPRYKTEVCRVFWKKGTCPYGKRCCFIHYLNEFNAETTKNLNSLTENLFLSDYDTKNINVDLQQSLSQTTMKFQSTLASKLTIKKKPLIEAYKIDNNVISPIEDKHSFFKIPNITGILETRSEYCTVDYLNACFLDTSFIPHIVERQEEYIPLSKRECSIWDDTNISSSSFIDKCN